MKKLSGWSFIKVYTFLIYIWMFAPIVAVVLLSFNPQQFWVISHGKLQL